MSKSPCEEKRLVFLFGRQIEVDPSNQSYKVLEQTEEAKVEVNNKSTSEETPLNTKAKKRKSKDKEKLKKKRSKSSSETNLEEPSIPADESWTCENCTLINKSSEENCEACGKPKGISWYCNSCSKINTNLSKCIECGAEKSGISCTKCTYLNTFHAKTCEQCEATLLKKENSIK